uniref:Uncharacterized protein n=1 Tax=Cyprinus carpio carpio TaxID=630221 RepID=A0A9J7YJ35_CYPCA
MSCDVQLAEMPCSLFLFHFLLAEVLSMATATTPVGQDQPTTADPPPVVFDLSQPPVIEGFAPLPRAKEENFKDKFIRKTKENPFVPIGLSSSHSLRKASSDTLHGQIGENHEKQHFTDVTCHHLRHQMKLEIDQHYFLS